MNKEFHIESVLDEAAYGLLVGHARCREVHVTDLVSIIVNKWLEENDN